MYHLLASVFPVAEQFHLFTANVFLARTDANATDAVCYPCYLFTKMALLVGWRTESFLAADGKFGAAYL